jgi:hypothetical protein
MAPMCPGPAQPTRVCPPEPLQAQVDVYPVDANPASERPAKSVRTDADGRFRISLATGQYQLVPRTAGGASSGNPVIVNLNEGDTMDVTLIVNTGMR